MPAPAVPPRPRLLAALRIVAGLGVVAGALWAPPLREALVALEPVVAPALFLAALLLWVRSSVAPWTPTWGSGGKAAKRREAPSAAVRASPGLHSMTIRFFDCWGWALAILAFALPVWAHWSLRPPGTAAAFGALFGRVPWSDMQQHYEGACRLLADGSFGPYSERRPLNAALLAVRLALGGGDLRVALALHAAVCGLCAWLLARAVGVRFGLAAALATFALMLGLSRDFLPTTATEPLGAALAALGVALLLLPGARARVGWAAAGLFALDAGLRARPGAQFLLPALMLWALWVHRARWRRALPALVAVALCGTLSTSALNALYGSGEATFTTYPAYTLYGLTRSSNWTQAAADYGDALDKMGNEKQVARFLYARAFENLRREPSRFARALLRNLTRFTGKLPANLARGISPFAFADTAVEPPTDADAARTTALGWPLLVAGFLGFAWFLWRASPPERAFWLCAAGGLLASVPFVYGDAGFRGLAAAYPLLAAALGAGLGRARWTPPLPAQRAVARGAGGLAVALLLVALAGPGLARALTRRPASPPAAPGALVLRPADAVAVVVTGVRRAPLERVPRIERRDFTRLLEWAGLEPAQQAHLAAAATPFAAVAAYDHATRRVVLLLAPPEMLQAEGFVSVEARTVPDSRFAEVAAWAPATRP